MTFDRLKELLEAYGADPDRWPAGERAAMLDLLARSQAARALRQKAVALDTLLDGAPLAVPSTDETDALAARIMRALPQRLAAHAEIPVRLAFGWPNWAALAAAAVAGLVIGWTSFGVGSGLAAAPELADVLATPAVLEAQLW